MLRLGLLILTTFGVISLPTIATGQIQWMENVSIAKTKAASEGKFVLLHFTGAQCRPCQQLETFVYPNVQLAQKMNELVVPVKIKSETQEKIFRQFSVATMPTDIVMTADGTIVVKRKSPSSVDNYLFMLKRLAKLKANQSASEKRKDAAKVSLTDEVQQLQKRDEKIRQSIMADRQFQPNSRGQLYKPKNQTVQNQFVPGNQRFQVQLDDPVVPKINRPDHKFQIPNVHAKQTLTDSGPPTNASVGDNPLRPKTNIGGNRIVRNQVTDNRNTANKMTANKMTANKNRNKTVVSNPYMNSTTPPSTPPQFQINDQRVGPVSQTPKRQNTNPNVNTTNKTVITNQFVSPKKEDKRAPKVVQNQYTLPKMNITPIQSSRPAKPAMNGFCPVTLMVEADWQKGDKQWGCYHRGKLFLFASQAKRDRFMKTPDEFCPLLAGFDPVEYERTGKLVDGGVKTGVVIEAHGKRQMILFSSEDAKLAFKKEPSRYLDFVKKMNERTARNPSKGSNVKLR